MVRNMGSAGRQGELCMSSYTVENHDAGQRLDKWLSSRLHMSRKKIKRFIDNGRVFVGSRRVVIAGWELEPHDRVELKPEESITAYSEKSRVRVYYEDRDIIVVEKPLGLPSVPKEGVKQDNLLSRIRAYMHRKFQDGPKSFVSPLHRLDAETSGVMVFALSKKGLGLLDQFKNHSIRREYVALVAGSVKESRGVISLPLEKGNFGGGRKVRAGRGVRAVTEFFVRERYRNATLLNVHVHTGRTHQIRVHLAQRGFPIIGDRLYAGRPLNDAPHFRRLALHAHVLSFCHPSSGRRLVFRSPIPRDMLGLIDSLRGF